MWIIITALFLWQEKSSWGRATADRHACVVHVNWSFVSYVLCSKQVNRFANLEEGGIGYVPGKNLLKVKGFFPPTFLNIARQTLTFSPVSQEIMLRSWCKISGILVVLRSMTLFSFSTILWISQTCAGRFGLAGDMRSIECCSSFVWGNKWHSIKDSRLINCEKKVTT